MWTAAHQGSILQTRSPVLPHSTPPANIVCICQPRNKASAHRRRAVVVMAARTSIMWFRRDLRLADNPALLAAAANTDTLLPVYVFDPRELQPRSFEGLSNSPAIPKLGPWRCRFLLQALHSLRQELRSRGSDLVVRVGKPEVVLPALVRELASTWSGSHTVSLHHTCDLMSESVSLEDEVAQRVSHAATAHGVTCEVHRHWSLTLYHPDDLPYKEMARAAGVRKSDLDSVCDELRGPEGACLNRTPNRLKHLPSVMTDFRRALAAAGVAVRAPLPAPPQLPPLPPSITHSNSTTSSTQAALAATLHDTPSCPTAVDAQPPSHPAAQDTQPGVIPTSVREVYRLTDTQQHLEALQQLLGHPWPGDHNWTLDGPVDPRSAFQLQGGESAALARLRRYVWGREEGGAVDRPPDNAPALTYYTNTRAQAVGDWSSTKLSAYLNLGCISPRTVWHEVAAVEQAVQAAGLPQEANCHWLAMHLQIRDYYIFTAIKASQALLSPAGIQQQPVQWIREADSREFTRWAQGTTGLPFVDACMRELSGSGWMSNRGRQNVASLLTKELGVDWRLGAQLFETLLVDHDVAVNYCNWNYFAGVGTDPRNRRFKTVTQGQQYDEEASLIRDWVPELAGLPSRFRHAPWTLSEEERSHFGVTLGVTYPEALVDPATQTGVLKPGDGAQKAKKQAKALSAGRAKGQ